MLEVERVGQSFGGREPLSRSGGSRGGRTPMLGVDVLRHVAAMAVIYLHMTSHSRYSPGTSAQMAHWAPLVDGAVACFFFLSGYFSRPGLTVRRIAITAQRLLVPYFVFCLIYTLMLGALGKIGLSDALTRTFTFAGVGPQLYFLPYLLLVSVAVSLAIDRISPTYPRLTIAGLILVFLAAYLALPTRSSTGPEPRLLALYALMYALGVYRARYATSRQCGLVAALAVAAIFVLPWTQREWDVPLVLLLVEAALRGSAVTARATRLPGSGGVYLLHTPILNYAISAALLKVGVREMSNVFATLALTYLAALALTLLVIRAMPRLRPFLLE